MALLDQYMIQKSEKLFIEGHIHGMNLHRYNIGHNEVLRR